MHKAFGPIVAELRKGQFDVTTGKVLTQQRLAQKIGASPRLIEAIEQGNKSYLDAEILVKLADAFALTTLERREFFALATGVPEQHLTLHSYPPATILSPLLAILGELQQPAYLHDDFLDIVAFNAPFSAFWGIANIDHIRPQKTINTLHGIFADVSPARTILSQMWHTIALRNVCLFRALSLRYRHTVYFKDLFQQLCRLPNFSTMWMYTQHEDQDFYSHVQISAYNHTMLGQVKYMVTRTTTVTPHGNLYVAVLAPASSNTQTIFSELAQPRQALVRQVVPWPNPYM